jgi:hypothetical protein
MGLGLGPRGKEGRARDGKGRGKWRAGLGWAAVVLASFILSLSFLHSNIQTNSFEFK